MLRLWSRSACGPARLPAWRAMGRRNLRSTVALANKVGQQQPGEIDANVTLPKTANETAPPEPPPSGPPPKKLFNLMSGVKAALLLVAFSFNAGVIYSQEHDEFREMFTNYVPGAEATLDFIYGQTKKKSARLVDADESKMYGYDWPSGEVQESKEAEDYVSPYMKMSAYDEGDTWGQRREEEGGVPRMGNMAETEAEAETEKQAKAEEETEIRAETDTVTEPEKWRVVDTESSMENRLETMTESERKADGRPYDSSSSTVCTQPQLQPGTEATAVNDASTDTPTEADKIRAKAEKKPADPLVTQSPPEHAAPTVVREREVGGTLDRLPAAIESPVAPTENTSLDHLGEGESESSKHDSEPGAVRAAVVGAEPLPERRTDSGESTEKAQAETAPHSHTAQGKAAPPSNPNEPEMAKSAAKQRVAKKDANATEQETPELTEEEEGPTKEDLMKEIGRLYQKLMYAEKQKEVAVAQSGVEKDAQFEARLAMEKEKTKAQVKQAAALAFKKAMQRFDKEKQELIAKHTDEVLEAQRKLEKLHEVYYQEQLKEETSKIQQVGRSAIAMQLGKERAATLKVLNNYYAAIKQLEMEFEHQQAQYADWVHVHDQWTVRLLIEDAVANGKPLAVPRSSLANSASPDLTKVVVESLPEALFDTGLASRVELTAQLPALRKEARRQALLPADGGDLLNYMLAAVVEKLTLQTWPAKVLSKDKGPSSFAETDAIMAEAEACMTVGDLDQATRIINQLRGWPRTVVMSWLDQARARLEAEQALDALGASCALLANSTARPAEDDQSQ